jgi:UDP-2,3-diacylglucosamine pyrophosphatase LpxH
MRAFIEAGNRAVFIIGNHDMELHWPSVRQDLVDGLGLTEEAQSRVRFCEWFYLSNGDTLIEHGNQYDAYSMAHNPIHPLIRKPGRKGFRTLVRIPFGNQAGKFMLNGMGLFNPHSEASFIKSSLAEYLVFYWKYVVRTQPGLMFTWFWSALVTGVVSVTEGLLPSLNDPLTVDARVEDIARRANATPQMVWSMRELHAHPAIYNPIKILRELWLDRALLLALIGFAAFQFLAVLNLFTRASWWWFVLPVFLLMPLFIFYARSIDSEVIKLQKPAFEAAPLAARITRVKRVVQGHTHLERHAWIGDVEYLNTGTWSPAFSDVECTQPYGRKCFAWIKPAPAGSGRVAELHAWSEDGAQPVTVETADPGLKQGA